ncbi:uncharacterized protein LOC62_06G008105 [Vanrija pseudolonga]|uniref:Uncharacterized protein n=1 Tax=Vanrija pseudolonga TaxID=143232 RepID=A0AAF0YHK2_9TREE|nr:hypothetical protein LOC62_06G008105 [Vanrija pseudolonga]
MSLAPAPVVPAATGPAHLYSLHTSVGFHLSTETAVLATLLQRSRAQHRSQLFLRHLVGAVRLARRVGAAFGADDKAALATLVPVFVANLVKAAAATRRMVQLHHFMPLQTVLLASYARLYAVALGLGRSVGLDDAVLGLGGKQTPVPAAAVVVPALIGDLDVAELGERVERSAAASPKRPREDGSATPKPKTVADRAESRDTTIASASASPRPVLPPKKPKQSVDGEPIPKKPKGVAADDAPKVKKPKLDDSLKKPKADDMGVKKPKPTAVVGEDLVPKAKKPKAEAGAKAAVGSPKPDMPTPKAKKPKPDAAPTPKLKTKKKKRDAMDDIFGF